MKVKHVMTKQRTLNDDDTKAKEMVKKTSSNGWQWKRGWWSSKQWIAWKSIVKKMNGEKSINLNGMYAGTCRLSLVPNVHVHPATSASTTPTQNGQYPIPSLSLYAVTVVYIFPTSPASPRWSTDLERPQFTHDESVLQVWRGKLTARWTLWC